MRHAHATLLGFLAVMVGLLAPARLPAAELTLEEEIQAGRGFVNAFIEQYGESENAEYRQLAETTLARLVQASGERPELPWRVVVLKYHPDNPVAKNASAWPGGYLVTDDAFLKVIAEGATADRERAEALLAGVLAHEIAHVIRHDTDALVPVFFKQATAAPPQLLMTLTATAGGSRENAADTRQKENACDRHGAFYLLRAGYRVEDMINVFRQLAVEEVDEVLFSSELDHARAGERVGNLLEVKNQVLEDERLYDEAVNILRLGLGEEMLQIAERNLDMVSVRFPKVLPVQHARAVLAHRRYLAKIAPEKLIYKPSFTFYRFRQTRSFPEDFLQEAIRLYEGILKEYEASGHQGLGPTVAAYALALTQAKETEKALTWAQKAVELAPEDWNARNILGIALHLAGQSAPAVEQFRKALSLASPEAPTALIERSLMTSSMEERAIWRYVGDLPPVEYGAALYNLGLALKESDKAAAAHAFRAYLVTDGKSDWARLAQGHLKTLGAAATAVGTVPVAGVTIGMPDVQVVKKVGEERGISPVEPGGQVWRYKEKGFSLFLDEGNRVRAGALYAPYAGDLGGGIKIGATAAQLEKTFGEPLARADASTREVWCYPAYGMTFVLNQGKVSKAIWSPAPPLGGGALPAAVPVTPGDTAARVKAALGAPDSGADQEKQGGVWVYDRDGLHLRVRFDQEGKAALVTFSRPGSAAVAGVKLGDPAARIRQALGGGVAVTDVDRSETFSFPDRGIGFVVRDAEVTVINLFARQG